jgi:hypothetical protein
MCLNTESRKATNLLADTFIYMQCLQLPNKLELCGLDPHKLHRSDRLQDDNKTKLINVLKVRNRTFCNSYSHLDIFDVMWQYLNFNSIN